MDIESKLPPNISNKTINHVLSLYFRFEDSEHFGRTLVEEVTGLKSSGASKLIKLLLDSKIIESVERFGKGKYHFVK